MKRPFHTEIVEGKRIHLNERDLTPQARVTMHVQRRAFIGDDEVKGHGWGFFHIRPIAVIEHQGSDERHIPIRDETSQKLTSMLAAALVVPVLAMLTIAIWRAFERWR